MNEITILEVFQLYTDLCSKISLIIRREVINKSINHKWIKITLNFVFHEILSNV